MVKYTVVLLLDLNIGDINKLIYWFSPQILKNLTNPRQELSNTLVDIEIDGEYLNWYLQEWSSTWGIKIYDHHKIVDEETVQDSGE